MDRSWVQLGGSLLLLFLCLVFFYFRTTLFSDEIVLVQKDHETFRDKKGFKKVSEGDCSL